MPSRTASTAYRAAGAAVGLRLWVRLVCAAFCLCGVGPGMGCNALRSAWTAWSRRRAACCVGRARGGELGQSTVEFAVVTVGFLALALGIGALWRGVSGGMFVEHAISSASHHIGGASPQAAADMLLY